MNNTLVEIYIPTAYCSFDVLVPENIRVYEATVLIAAAVEKQTNGVYCSSSDPILCDRVSGTILDISKSFAELEICNGSQLMLI